MTSYATACVPDTTETVESSQRSPRERSDEQLMARVCKHDQEAFTCLLGRHLNAVHAYLYRLTGSRADADDLSQETFLRVWQKASTFKPGRVKLSTWLFRIAHNLCIDQFRKRLPSDDVELDEIADPAADQASELLNRRKLERLNIALQGLPEAQRSAIVLCQVQGFSNLEAAEILGVGVRALESLLARARRRLKKQLPESPDE